MTDDDAISLYNRLGACGWTKSFNWGDGAAWEQDWKGAAKPGGGTENSWVDSVDLAYFSGHGNSSSFLFGSNIDDHNLTYNDCNMEWAIWTPSGSACQPAIRWQTPTWATGSGAWIIST